MQTTELLSFVFENLQTLKAGVVIVDNSFRIVFANQRLLDIADISFENLQHQHISTLLSAKEVCLPIDNAQLSFATELQGTGQTMGVWLTLTDIKRNSQIIGRSLMIKRLDIKEAQGDQSILAAIIESSDDAIISKNLNGIISSWNKGAENIFGYTADEVIGKSITILLPYNRLSEEHTILNNIRMGNRIEHFETIRLHKSGKEIHLSLTVSPIKDLYGNIIGASKVARDITEKIRTETAIKLSNQRLRVLNRLSEDISATMDLQIILQTATNVATKLVGANFGAFIYNTSHNDNNHALYALAGPQKEFFETLKSNINDDFFKATFANFEIIRINDAIQHPKTTKNGVPRGAPIVSYMAAPVTSISGRVLGGFFFGHQQPGQFMPEHEDLLNAVSKQTAVALDNANLFAELNDISRKKDEFIALATHELKTPLTSMGGFLQVLHHRLPANDANGYLADKALKQLQKLNILFNDLFDISRIQAGKLQLNLEKVNVCLLVNELIENYQETSPEYVFKINAPKSCHIPADKMRLEQAFINLINNAIKYSPPKTSIHINMVKHSCHLVVEIKDNGIGIDKEYQKNIFSQFYRVRSVSGTISGLGLGLYITKEIIERHQGKIAVSSELNQGTTFTITLPLKNDSVFANEKNNNLRS